MRTRKKRNAIEKPKKVEKKHDKKDWIKTNQIGITGNICWRNRNRD